MLLRIIFYMLSFNLAKVWRMIGTNSRTVVIIPSTDRYEALYTRDQVTGLNPFGA